MRVPRTGEGAGERSRAGMVDRGTARLWALGRFRPSATLNDNHTGEESQ
jgi:hypothetical protein